MRIEEASRQDVDALLVRLEPVRLPHNPNPNPAHSPPTHRPRSIPRVQFYFAGLDYTLPTGQRLKRGDLCELVGKAAPGTHAHPNGLRVWVGRIGVCADVSLKDLSEYPPPAPVDEPPATVDEAADEAEDVKLLDPAEAADVFEMSRSSQYGGSLVTTPEGKRRTSIKTDLRSSMSPPSRRSTLTESTARVSARCASLREEFGGCVRWSRTEIPASAGVGPEAARPPESNWRPRVSWSRTARPLTHSPSLPAPWLDPGSLPMRLPMRMRSPKIVSPISNALIWQVAE